MRAMAVAVAALVLGGDLRGQAVTGPRWFPFWGVAAGVGVPDNTAGVALSLNAAARWRRLYGTVTPLDLTVTGEADNERYVRESDSICRDTETGRFASASRCASKTLYGAMIDGALYFPQPGGTGALLGAGYRVGAGSGPFAMIGAIVGEPRENHAVFRASVGRHFIQASIGGAWPLRS